MSTEPTDIELLEAWRAGDGAAGQALFKRHFRKIYRFFETKCGPDVDELVQSTFLACVRAKNNFRGDSSFSTYLFTIARHELYRVFSERRRDLDRIDFEVSSVAELAPTLASGTLSVLYPVTTTKGMPRSCSARAMGVDGVPFKFMSRQTASGLNSPKADKAC